MMIASEDTGFWTSRAATNRLEGRRSSVLGTPCDAECFPHHDRAVNHHAEVECAQRQQIRGNAIEIEKNRPDSNRREW